jgi:DNA-binding response OmpR family regulator
MDGLAVCKELREKVGYLPILMLTAKDDVVDKVLGLEMGADDYITKPFSLRELEARIKSVLRRTRNGPSADGMRDEAPIVRGRLRIDSAKREVTIGDRQVELTPKEFDLGLLLRRLRPDDRFTYQSSARQDRREPREPADGPDRLGHRLQVQRRTVIRVIRVGERR